MDYTQEQFRADIRKAVLSMQSKIELDVSELSPKNIAQIMIWCDEKNYWYELKGDVMTVEILKGFSRVPQEKKKEDFLALFNGIEEDEELNQRRIKNLEELRY